MSGEHKGIVGYMHDKHHREAMSVYAAMSNYKLIMLYTIQHGCTLCRVSAVSLLHKKRGKEKMETNIKCQY